MTQHGLLYDLQVFGDFYLAISSDGLIVQTRQTPAWGSPVIAYNAAVAVGLGQHKINVAGHPLRTSIDGVPVTLSTTEPTALPGGDIITSDGATIVVERASGDKVTIATVPWGDALNVTVSVAGALQGLLGGGGDGDPKNDLVLRGGQALPYPPSYADLKGPFAQSWLVPPEESLFDDLAPPPPLGEEGLADPGCTTKGGDQVAHNPAWPSLEPGTCATTQGFSVKDAAALCGGPVKYFSYTCSDTPAKPPYKEPQIAWTSYYACCDEPFSSTPATTLPLPPASSFSAPEHPFTVANLEPNLRKEAETLCAAQGVTDPGLLDACTLDVAVLGDGQYATIYHGMPAPRLVLVPLDGSAPPVMSPGPSTDHAEAAGAAADAPACAVGPTGRATPWLWLFGAISAALGRRLVPRRRRGSRRRASQEA
ncbi:MAG: hypothetical protein U0359_14095 [Byssovorax sp.]